MEHFRHQQESKVFNVGIKTELEFTELKKTLIFKKKRRSARDLEERFRKNVQNELLGSWKIRSQ